MRLSCRCKPLSGRGWLEKLRCAADAEKTDLRALFARLNARRGPREAIIAVTASILTAVYWMLRRDVGDQDLWAEHFDRRDRNRFVRRFGELSSDVTLTRHEMA